MIVALHRLCAIGLKVSTFLVQNIDAVQILHAY
ncbi:hypothetical protein NB716_003903 [Pantoea ananatis]|nr:hypothetical protein [Pantoea ananatis]MCW0355109.1 hypothetical protein [Pantoea ananatis]